MDNAFELWLKNTYKVETIREDNFNQYDLEAAWDYQQDKIEKQAAELEALRGFFNAIDNLPINDNRFNNQCIEIAEKYGLIDKNGNPTSLFKGE